MAVVSELSMYQATSLKLEAELGYGVAVSSSFDFRVLLLLCVLVSHKPWLWTYHCRRQQEVYDEARSNFEAGHAPTEDMYHQWLRMSRLEDVRREEAAIRKQEAIAAQQQGPHLVTRTTAEPRPNAYIPSDGLGLPRPYGKFAQFKPAEAGATMRHIRKPKPKEIEL